MANPMHLKVDWKGLLATACVFVAAGTPLRPQAPTMPANSAVPAGGSIVLTLAGADAEGKRARVKVAIDGGGQDVSDAALFVDEERSPTHIESRAGEQVVSVPVGAGNHLITVSALVGDKWLQQTLEVTGRVGGEDVRPVVQAPPETSGFELKSPDGSHIARADGYGLITMTETRQGYTNAELRGHTNAVIATAFSLGGKLLASSSADGTVRLWRVTDGTQLLSIPVSETTASAQGGLAVIRVIGVGISPNLRWIVGLEICASMAERCKAVGRDVTESRLYLWEIATGAVLKKMDVPINSTLVGLIRGDADALLFSLDSTLVGEERTGGLIHIADGKPVFRFSECEGATMGTDDKGTLPMLTPRGVEPVSITAYPPNHRIQLPYQADKPIAPKPMPVPQQREAPSAAPVDVDAVLAAGFRDDGSIELASRYSIFQLGADGVTQSTPLDLSRAPFQYVLLGLFPHGDRLVSADYTNFSQSHMIGVWDAKSGQQIATSPNTAGASYPGLLHNGETTGLAVSDDGEVAALADTVARIQVFSTASAVPVADLRGTDLPNAMAFSPDHRILAAGYGGGAGYRPRVPGEMPANDGATAEDHSIILWDVVHQRKVRVLAGHAPLTSAVAWSADGRWIASSGEDQKLKLWDAASGQMLAQADAPAFAQLRFLQHGTVLIAAGSGSISVFDLPSLKCTATVQTDGNVRSVTSNPDENRILTTSQEGTTLWRFSAGQLARIGSFLLFPDGGYVFYTPDGYYLNSGSSRALAFAVGDRVVPFDEFDLRFNRPDLVLQRIGRGSPELIASYATAYRNRVEHSGIAEEVVNGKVPRPFVSIREAKRVDDKAILTISAVAAGPKLKRTFVWVNGVPLYGKTGLEANTSEQSITVPLTAGDDHIEVSVVDERGAESIRDATDVTLAARAVGPQLHVLAVGVSQYRNGDFNLKYADHDAAAIGAYFQEQRYKFSRLSLDLKTNATATHDEIMRSLAALRSLPPDDYVIISFAGHGLLDDKLNFYFAPYDMDFAHPGAKGISYKELEDALYAIPARHKVLLLDSCHSGEVRDEGTTTATSISGNTAQSGTRGDKGARVVATPAVGGARGLGIDTVSLNEADSASYIEQLFGDLRRGPGASVLSSSSAAQYSYESEKYNGGIFTYELIRCMRSGEADTLRDGEFHVSELRQCVANHVLEDTDGRQRPTARGRDPFDQAIAREDYLVRSYHVQGPYLRVSPMATQQKGSRVLWIDGRQFVTVDAETGKVESTLKSPCNDSFFLGYGEGYIVGGCQARMDQPQLMIWRFPPGQKGPAPGDETDAACLPVKQTGQAEGAGDADAAVCRLDVGNWQLMGGDAAADGTVVLAVHNFSKEQSKWISALQVWDMNSRKLLRTLPMADMSFNSRIAISPDHSLATITESVGTQQRLTVVDLANGDLLWHKDNQYLIQSAISSDSKRLAVATAAEGAVLHPRLQLVDARTGRESAAADVSEEDEAVTAVAFAPDDSLVTLAVIRSGARDSTVGELRFMNTHDLKMLGQELPQACEAVTLRFVQSGVRIIAGCKKEAPFGSESAETEFRIWDSAHLMSDLRLHSR